MTARDTYEEEYLLYFVSECVPYIAIRFLPIIIIQAVYRRWRFGPQHGFARIMRWEVEKSPEKVEENDVEATFTIRDNEFTHAMWNYA